MGPGSEVRLHVPADQQSDKQAVKQGKKLSVAAISALLATEQPWGSQALHPRTFPGPNLAEQSTFGSPASPGQCSLQMPSASKKPVPLSPACVSPQQL